MLVLSPVLLTVLRVLLFIYTLFKAVCLGMTNLAGGQGLSKILLPKKYGSNGSKHMEWQMTECGITRLSVSDESY